MEKMADPQERFVSNSFVQTPILGSNPPVVKKKRNLPGTPDPEAEVIALSPKTLMATNRFLCEICGKGFQRDQNLQLHRRGHNLPWKLKQRTSKEIKKRVYVCPEKTCVHHHPSRALGDLTGIKKHFCRKHGEKKWKCEKCSKRYAVQSDWKAHSKTCGTREYKCDCGTLFSRRDSFITHRAFCDALAEETARVNAAKGMGNINYNHFIMGSSASSLGANMAKPYSSVFKPIPTSLNGASPTMPAGLHLWMGQGSQAHQSIMTHNNNINLQDIIHHHDNNEDHHQVLVGNNSQNYHQLTWVFGSSGNVEQELTSTNSLPLSHVKDVSGSTNDQLVSVPSLYSNQLQLQQCHQNPNYANMSATALLQKAAQFGSTTTTTPPTSADPSIFLGNFGLKCNNISTSTTTTTSVNQDGNKFSGSYGSINPLMQISRLGNDDVEDSTGNLSQIFPAAKRRKTQGDQDQSMAGGQTRDFLGVGVQTICHPSSIHGWI